MLKGIWKSGSEDLSDAFDLRRHIFIEEQKVPVNLEFTGDDTEYEHLVIYDDGEAVATGRMCFVSPKRVHLGRICVKKEKRGQKIGDFVNCKPFLDSSRACFSCRVKMTRKVFLVPCHPEPTP